MLQSFRHGKLSDVVDCICDPRGDKELKVQFLEPYEKT